jgi:hypothetical protein
MIDNKAYDDLKQTKSQTNGQYMINATKIGMMTQLKIYMIFQLD